MSVVCCRVNEDSIEIAADSIVCRGWMKSTDNVKLHRVNNMIVGSSGYVEESSLFLLFAETHSPTSPDTRGIIEFLTEFSQWKQKVNNTWGIGNSYILVYKGKAYGIYSFEVTEINTYFAIGAGVEFATAALHLGNSPKKAVEVACELSCMCAQPIVSYVEMKNGN